MFVVMGAGAANGIKATDNLDRGFGCEGRFNGGIVVHKMIRISFAFKADGA